MWMSGWSENAGGPGCEVGNLLEEVSNHHGNKAGGIDIHLAAMMVVLVVELRRIVSKKSKHTDGRISSSFSQF